MVMPDGTPTWVRIVVGIIAGVAMGAVAGTITGFFLIRILREPS
jgi:ABC-type uncharacterized transport system permease subunit